MEFDLRSMKQRATALMRTTKPSLWVVSILFCVIMLIFITAFCVIAAFDLKDEIFLLAITISEIVYINFRSSCNIYCLKVVREEQTSISDVFSAFKSNFIGMLLLGIIKDVCYFIGICFLGVGFIFPFYWFRFSVYIIYDEKVNPFKALGKSMKLLKGHYGELIKVDISNLGWYAAMIFSGGIAGFYVKPYTTLVYAELYEHLKAQKEMFG